jgi:hypothetical protein
MAPHVYHMVPNNIHGTVLYPLNVLKNIHPEAYTSHAKKYIDREWLLQRKIDALDCLWNDVLHCTPIHPAKIYPLLREIGFGYPPEKFYQIDCSDWRPDQCALMEYSTDGKERIYSKGLPCDFHGFDTLPDETIAYYRKCHADKIHPMIFACTPHILLKGSINVSDAPIIDA